MFARPPIRRAVVAIIFTMLVVGLSVVLASNLRGYWSQDVTQIVGRLGEMHGVAITAEMSTDEIVEVLGREFDSQEIRIIDESMKLVVIEARGEKIYFSPSEDITRVDVVASTHSFVQGKYRSTIGREGGGTTMIETEVPVVVGVDYRISAVPGTRRSMNSVRTIVYTDKAQEVIRRIASSSLDELRRREYRIDLQRDDIVLPPGR